MSTKVYCKCWSRSQNHLQSTTSFYYTFAPFPCAAVQLEPAAAAIYPEQQHSYIAMVMDSRLGLWEGLGFRITKDKPFD